MRIEKKSPCILPSISILNVHFYQDSDAEFLLFFNIAVIELINLLLYRPLDKKTQFTKYQLNFVPTLGRQCFV